jgi:Protein of unknown function (DUF1553)/Protein of unknown function (DUF1549)
VREQVAGDILARQGSAAGYADSVVATGFLALARRYATAPYELWHLTLEDAIETTGRAFLGLSLRCARCHDHKFDPVTQRDYYALYGIFASTNFPYTGSEEFHSKKFPRMNFVPLQAPCGSEGKPKADKTDQPSAYAVTEGPPRDVALQRKGEPGNEGPVVPRGVPRFEFLEADPPAATPENGSGRLELARWLTQPGHPLTARVMANRIWHYHFGRGIVATPSNFGVRGEPPSHPELLEWLTAKLVASGWSIKVLQREIVLSRTYQLSSSFEAHDALVDPDNRLLWRFTRRRLDAEAIRDAMLAASGLLDERLAGRHPFPPIERWHWTQHDPFKAVYPTDRRSVYVMTQRLAKHPYMGLFDGPDTNTSTDVRSRSTVPLQALYLMNDPFVDRCAAGLADRLLAGSAHETEQIAAAHARAWGRPPDRAETIRAARFLAEYRAALASAGVSAGDCARQALAGLAKAMLTADEFLYID